MKYLSACVAALSAVVGIVAYQALAAQRDAVASEPAMSAAAHRAALVRANIKYVFVIYQENRSFDSYFGTFPGADGLYSGAPRKPPGFEQPIMNLDGSMTTVEPFRIGPAQYAADTDDVDHSHSRILAKMDVKDGVAQMDQFALTEERKYSLAGNPSLMAKQFGELAMAYEDCDTVPFLWRYAHKFTLFDHIFQEMTGPSTLGNLAIISAQSGVTQWLLHPDQLPSGNGDKGSGVPVLDDADPFWGSPSDNATRDRLPVNPKDFPGYEIQRNLTFASLPLTLSGGALGSIVKGDTAPDDLLDVHEDVTALEHGAFRSVPWGWYEEGYDAEPSDNDAPDPAGLHGSYITHHNGPQYFGYVANNAKMRAHLHGLDDFRRAIDAHALPANGGVYYLKGGSRNILHLQSASDDPEVRKRFRGDDDHPAYADAQISEAVVADLIDRIVASPYWKDSAIVITWDDSEGDYDHVAPNVRQTVPGVGVISDGPRVPLILISPFAKQGAVIHDVGDQASVVKLVNAVFGLPSLASLPNEAHGIQLGRERFQQDDLGPLDAYSSALTDLLSAFDDARLEHRRAPIPKSDAEIGDALIKVLPQQSGYGCGQLQIVPTDVALHLANPIPADFNPRPKTNPTKQ